MGPLLPGCFLCCGRTSWAPFFSSTQHRNSQPLSSPQVERQLQVLAVWPNYTMAWSFLTIKYCCEKSYLFSVSEIPLLILGFTILRDCVVTLACPWRCPGWRLGSDKPNIGYSSQKWVGIMGRVALCGWAFSGAIVILLGGWKRKEVCWEPTWL